MGKWVKFLLWLSEEYIYKKWPKFHLFSWNKLDLVLWTWLRGFPGGSGKESAYQCRRRRRLRFSPWGGKIPWRTKWQPTPIFLPGQFHGQRSLVGYSPWDRKESDVTEYAHVHAHNMAWAVCKPGLQFILTLLCNLRVC